MTDKLTLIHACSTCSCLFLPWPLAPPQHHQIFHPKWPKCSLGHKLTQLRGSSDTTLLESKPNTHLLSAMWIYTASLQERKWDVTRSQHDWSCTVQWSYSSLQRVEILSIFIHRDIFSINHPNATNISNAMHHLKRPSTRICKFAFFNAFLLDPFFLRISSGFEKCIYSLAPFHQFSFLICFPLV